MRKVLIIVTSPFDAYGIGSVVRTYTKALLGDFNFVFLLCAGADEVGEKFIESNKIERINLNCSRLHNPFVYTKRLIEHLKSNNYDVAHAHGNSGTLFLEMYAAKKANISIRIAHCHNTSCKYKLLHYILKPFLNKYLTHALACSKLAGEWLFNQPYVVLNNAIDSASYRYTDSIRLKIRKDLNAENSFVLLNVGRLSRQKNQDYIIKLMPSIIEKCPQAKFFIVGGGELEQDYLRLIDELHLSENIILLGQKNNVSEYYQAADLFLFPSSFEGLGLVLVEAQASGLLCLASTEVPLEANAGNNVTYLDLSSPEKWVDNIVKYSLEEYNRVEKSDRCIETIRNNGYDIEVNSIRLALLYKANEQPA